MAVHIGDTPAEAAFRAEARAWLEAQAPPRTGDLWRASIADDPEAMAEARRWQARLHAGGWAGITWPVEHGGRGGTMAEAVVFAQEQQRVEVAAGLFMVAIDMVGPTIMAHGTEDQRRRFLAPMLRGEHVWCQLFSEPGAGSDLASLATRAELDGDEWVVNGQKVWTSHAHHADRGILLARTDPDSAGNRGISCFLLDMATPGIDVRPLRQITGASHFNEVFFDDVRIPTADVCGPVGEGWRVALTTLTSERGAIGAGEGVVGWRDLHALARSTGATEDPVLRQELAAAYSRAQIIRFLDYRLQTAWSRGEVPGPETSVIKLAVSRHAEANGDLLMAVQGAGGLVADDWSLLFLNQWNVRLGGGTEQIQRNLLGGRVLGLPPEPRA